MKKKVKPILLPSENKSLFAKCIKDGVYAEKTGDLVLTGSHTSLNKSNDVWEYQHLYLISDDEIKEGDYFYDGDGELCQYTSDYRVNPNKYEDNKKVIASTDSELELTAPTDFEEGLYYATPFPQIPEHFIKAYVKANGEIDEVYVEYAWFNELGERCLPESNTEKHLKLRPTDNNEVIISMVEEKMYSRDEVEKAMLAFVYYINDKSNDIIIEGSTVARWIEEKL